MGEYGKSATEIDGVMLALRVVVSKGVYQRKTNSAFDCHSERSKAK
jgi:hypothetical protein